MFTPKIIIKNAEDFPNEPALSIKDSSNNWQTDSWADLKDHAFKISKSLISLKLIQMIKSVYIAIIEKSGLTYMQQLK